MLNTIKQVFHSPKFLVGFFLFVAVLLTCLIYPLIVTDDPLAMIGNGNFYKPGTYVNQEDVVYASGNMMNVQRDPTAALEGTLTQTNIDDMRTWFKKCTDIAPEEIDSADLATLVGYWRQNYDAEKTKAAKFTSAKRKAYDRINKTIKQAFTNASLEVYRKNSDGELEEVKTVNGKTYVNTKDVTTRTFILGTDNFGRDVLTELVAATKTSLSIGLIAGLIATAIGLFLGLLSGYVGGTPDNVIMFITNLFTVIPSFIILILISYSVGNAARGVTLVAVIIGITAWPWTTRSVRSQVISLRNRDHVNLSKLSGHSMLRIIFTDVLPYIASYVVMALILQISSGILAEAQLSMLGLGPATTKNATLGLMMNWATQYAAHLNGSWWAYFPVILMIAVISFSLNLMNTGLDQVFNPQLRD